MCWGLSHAYRALINTIQHPVGEEKVSGSDDNTTGTTATAAPATGTEATPTPQSLVGTGPAAGPGNQPVLVSVTTVRKKKKWMQSHLIE